MAESVDELKGIADSKRADAELARAEANRLAETAAALHADAATKISDANAAAERAAQDALRKETEVAEAAAAEKASEAAEVRAIAADATARAVVLEAEAAELSKHAADLADKQRPLVPSFRVEGGGWRPLSAGSTARDRQVADADGYIYNHVSDHPGGDWIYRLQS